MRLPLAFDADLSLCLPADESKPPQWRSPIHLPGGCHASRYDACEELRKALTALTPACDRTPLSPPSNVERVIVGEGGTLSNEAEASFGLVAHEVRDGTVRCT